MFLRQVEGEWEEIAGQAGFKLPPDMIQEIRKVTGENADYLRLVEVCDAWLRAKRATPTWRQAAKVMERLGHKDIAKSMLDIYTTGECWRLYHCNTCLHG